MFHIPSNHRILFAVALCVCITAIGTSGYVLIEGYGLMEGFYMTVITLTTVGFGEVHTLSDTGRSFTIVLIIAGVVSLAFTGHAIAESLLESIWSHKGEIKKMKKRISLLHSHYIVCGYGRVGATTVELFQKEGADFVIIDSNPKSCQELQKKDILFVEGDATHEEILMEAGIKQAKGLLALLDSDPANLFICLSARELNPTLHIIARAEDSSSEKKIHQAGADKVVSPFASAGTQIADDILAATGVAVFRKQSEIKADPVPQWIILQEGSTMVGETVGVLSVEMGHEVLGLRRGAADHLCPDHGMLLEEGDMVFVLSGETLGDLPDTHHLSSPKKVVIVDDNPVIVRLYRRLFQKAGYNPLIATNGREGLDLIREVQPHAAVIDFLLPELSGIEVCAEVRKSKELINTKLILFTSDDSAETRKEAMDAGADDVVLKSPDALEVVETVNRILSKTRDRSSVAQ